MSNFQRQMQRASQKQELEIVRQTVQALQAENTQLQMENKSLFRAMGAMVLVSGGELRIPRDIDAALKGKHLLSDVDDETNEIVFKVVDSTAAAVEETTEEAATN